MSDDNLVEINVDIDDETMEIINSMVDKGLYSTPEEVIVASIRNYFSQEDNKE